MSRICRPVRCMPFAPLRRSLQLQATMIRYLTLPCSVLGKAQLQDEGMRHGPTSSQATRYIMNSSHHMARVGRGTNPFLAWFSGPICAGGSTCGTGSGHVQPGPAVIFAFLIDGKAQALVEAPRRHIG